MSENVYEIKWFTFHIIVLNVLNFGSLFIFCTIFGDSNTDERVIRKQVKSYNNMSAILGYFVVINCSCNTNIVVDSFGSKLWAQLQIAQINV